MIRSKESYKTAKSETSYLSDKHQGRGLFKKLYHDLMIKSKQENFDFVWGFTKLGELWGKLGFNVVEGYLYDKNMEKVSTFPVAMDIF